MLTPSKKQEKSKQPSMKKEDRWNLLVVQEHSMGKPGLSPGMSVILNCSTRGQAALVGKTLLDMQNDNVVNLGRYQKCKNAGEPAESL